MKLFNFSFIFLIRISSVFTSTCSNTSTEACKKWCNDGVNEADEYVQNLLGNGQWYKYDDCHDYRCYCQKSCYVLGSSTDCNWAEYSCPYGSRSSSFSGSPSCWEEWPGMDYCAFLIYSDGSGHPLGFDNCNVYSEGFYPLKDILNVENDSFYGKIDDGDITNPDKIIYFYKEDDTNNCRLVTTENYTGGIHKNGHFYVYLDDKWNRKSCSDLNEGYAIIYSSSTLNSRIKQRVITSGCEIVRASNYGIETNYIFPYDKSKVINCYNGYDCYILSGENGYYLGDNGIIKCESNTCSYIKYNSSTLKYYINKGSLTNSKPFIKCINKICTTTVASVGYYINGGNNKLMYCEKENVCNEIATNVSSTSKYYFNNDENNDKKPIIKCSKGTCQTIAAPVGYIINGHNNDLIYCESSSVCKSIERSTLSTYEFYLNSGDDKSSKALIKCNYNGCATTIPSIGYYLDGEYNLIYCESKTLCSKVTEINSSSLMYYLSNGNIGIKPLIKCVQGKCNMIKASTGYYLNGANNNIIHCINPSMCSEGEINTTTISKYYLNKGDDKKSNPLIDCNNSACSTIQASIGHYLNSANDNVIHCESSKSCRDVNESRSNIFYLNKGGDMKSKPLIKCVDGTCITTKASSGYFVIGTNNVIKCTGTTTCTEIDKNISSIPLYYLNSGSDKKLKPLIRCVNGTCATINIAKGYYLNSANNGLINCLTTTTCSKVTQILEFKYYINNGDNTNLLITCTNNVCSTLTASVGYYIDGSNDNLIYCKNPYVCSKMAKNTLSISKYYINNGGDKDSKPLIDCVNGSCTTTKASKGYYVDGANDLIYCENDSVCNKMMKNTSSLSKHYLNAGGDKASNPMIKCIKTGCTTLLAVAGYYLDGEKRLINCENSTVCHEVSINTSATPELYTDNGSDRDPKSLIKCVNGTCKILSSVGYHLDEAKDLFYCTNINTCEKVDKNTSSTHIYYLNSSEDMDVKPLISCAKRSCETITASVGGYFTDSTNNLIYCESETVCYEVAKNPSTTPKYYINNNDDYENYPLIRCTNSNCKTIGASEGYSMDGENIWVIHCFVETVYMEKSTLCKKVDKNQDIVSIYYLNNGIDKATNPLIQCAENECGTIQAKIGYYINTENNNLIYCDQKTRCTKGEINEGQTSKYYLNNDERSNPLIKCAEGSCSAVEGSTGYYINSDINSSLIYCSGKSTCSQGEENDTPISKYYFNNGDDKKPLIECTSHTCTTISTTSGGYINGVNNNVIYCINDTECAEENLIESTTISKYYVNNGSNKNNTPLIICDANGCQFSTASIGGYINGQQDQGGAIYCESTTSCSEANLDGEYYYLNKSNDSNANPLIKCNDSICSTTTSSSGYYVDGASSLIYCSSDVKCSIKNTPSKSTYYLNNGEKSSLIECIVGGGCSSKDAAIGYYISEVNNKLIYCGYNNNPNNCDITNTITNNPNYYENSGEDSSNKPLIKCNSEGCTTIEVTTGYYIKSINKGVIYCSSNNNNWNCQQVSNTSGKNYISNGEDKNSKPIIMCNSNGCTNSEVDTSTTKYYLNGTGSNPLIKCNSKGCTTLTASIGGYISGSGLVYCESATICKEVTSGFSGKYYLNGGEDKDTKQLIKCDSTCETLASSTFVNCYGGDLPEFYKNGYNSNQLIKCIHNSCEIYSNVQSGAYINNKNLLIYCKKSGNNVTCNEVTTYYSQPYPHYFLNASGIGGALIRYDKRSAMLSNFIDICFIDPDTTEYANYGSNTSKITCDTTSKTCQESN